MIVKNKNKRSSSIELKSEIEKIDELNEEDIISNKVKILI